MRTSIVVTLDDSSTIRLVSGGRQFYQVKHDYEMPDGVWRVDPEVFRLNPQHYVEMTERIQLFMFGLLADEMKKVGATHAQMRAAWAYLYDGARAFTNGKGVEACKDYINARNLSEAYSTPALSTLVCGGNILAGKEVMAKYDTFVEPCIEVETIDPNNLPATISRATHPWLISYATIATFNKLPDGYKVTRFSTPKMLGSNAPVPIMSDGPVYYPLRLLKRVTSDKIPTPYHYE